MSSRITTTFILNEQIILSSPDNISAQTFESQKVLELVRCSGKPLLESFKETIEEWISRIEVDRPSYSLIPINPTALDNGGFIVKYRNHEIVKLILFPPSNRSKEGKRIVASAMVKLTYVKKMDLITMDNRCRTFYINEDKFTATQAIDGKVKTLLEVLDYVLPTRCNAIVQAISMIFNIQPQSILLDTFRKRYVISTPYLFNDREIPPQPKIFYKYVSLSTYNNMLTHQTFRMNSIVCQSDESESLYFGEFLCGEYDIEEDKLRTVLKESNQLISSFTTSANDEIMWNEYGDNGKGVLLGFKSMGRDKLSPIKYIDETSTDLRRIKKNIQELKAQKIQLHFSEIDNLHRFIKNDKYKFEKEWRLIYEFPGELDSCVYYDSKEDTEIYAKYHDFAFKGNLLPELDIALVSVTFGPKQRRSNIPLLTQRTIACFGDDIIVDY